MTFPYETRKPPNNDNPRVTKLLVEWLLKPSAKTNLSIRHKSVFSFSVIHLRRKGHSGDFSARALPRITAFYRPLAQAIS